MRLTLELESYQLHVPAKNAGVAEVAHVEEKGSRDERVAVVQKSQETMLETMKKLSERLERLELVRGRLGEQNTRQHAEPAVHLLELRKTGPSFSGVHTKKEHLRQAAGKRPTLDAVSLAREGKIKGSEGNKYIFSTNIADTLKIVGRVEGISVHLVLDTGASVNLLRKDVWEKICAKCNCHFEPWGGERLVGAEGSPLRVLGAACLELDLQTKHKFKVRFVIVGVLSVEGILGLDFLSVNKCTIDLEKRQLEVDEKWLTLTVKEKENSPDLIQHSKVQMHHQSASIQ